MVDYNWTHWKIDAGKEEQTLFSKEKDWAKFLFVRHKIHIIVFFPLNFPDLDPCASSENVASTEKCLLNFRRKYRFGSVF